VSLYVWITLGCVAAIVLIVAVPIVARVIVLRWSDRQYEKQRQPIPSFLLDHGGSRPDEYWRRVEKPSGRWG
jgi:hypothetical protein